MKFISNLFFTDIDFCKANVIQGLDLNFNLSFLTKHENYNKSKASFNVVPAFVRNELGEFRFFYLMFIFFYMFQEERNSTLVLGFV